MLDAPDDAEAAEDEVPSMVLPALDVAVAMEDGESADEAGAEEDGAETDCAEEDGGWLELAGAPDDAATDDDGAPAEEEGSWLELAAAPEDAAADDEAVPEDEEGSGPEVVPVTELAVSMWLELVGAPEEEDVVEVLPSTVPPAHASTVDSENSRNAAWFSVRMGPPGMHLEIAWGLLGGQFPGCAAGARLGMGPRLSEDGS